MATPTEFTPKHCYQCGHCLVDNLRAPGQVIVIGEYDPSRPLICTECDTQQPRETLIADDRARSIRAAESDRLIALAAPDKTFTRSKGGTAERECIIADIEVPDLYIFWEYMNFNEPPAGVDPGWWERNKKAILDCWNLAHDMKKHIQGI